MKKIFILIENFYPAYKAGGPIQSVTNLISLLENDYMFYIITSAYDMKSNEVMEGIVPNKWNLITLPTAQKTISVWYAEKNNLNYKSFKKLLKDKKPDYVYLNGIFSFRYFLIPLIAASYFKPGPQIVICPRGMLQAGALAGKSFKKKIYLNTLKLTGLLRTVKWHATNLEEKEDILRQFPKSNRIVIAMNIPKTPLQEIPPILKSPGNIRLIYLSLITEKKNLLFLLELIGSTKNITLDIYGPIKDLSYWQKCEKLLSQMPDRVKYCGDVLPLHVQKTLSNYHASVLLTRGENFGHALYEMLSVGRPIITSHYTPWDNLEQKSAGWNLDITNISECIVQLIKIKELDQSNYLKFCNGAYQLANSYYTQAINSSNYKTMFN